MGGGKGGQTAEVYDFLMSLDYAICHGPIDALNALVVKDKIAWQVPVEKNAVVKISEKELFGGDDAEGGMVGTMEVYLGGWDQYASPELAVRFGLASADCVGYRGLAHLFFRGSLSAANTSDYDHSGTDGGMTVEDAARIVLGKMGLMGAMFLAVLGPGRSMVSSGPPTIRIYLRRSHMSVAALGDCPPMAGSGPSSNVKMVSSFSPPAS